MVKAKIVGSNGKAFEANFASISQPQIVFQEQRVKIGMTATGFVARNHIVTPITVVLPKDSVELAESLFVAAPFTMLWEGTTGHQVIAHGIYVLDEVTDSPDKWLLSAEGFHLVHDEDAS